VIWAWHMAYMGEKKHAFRVLVEKISRKKSA
jgi:hypothetical protein